MAFPPACRAPSGTFTADSEGAFNFYLLSPVNANRETVSGLDFQTDYHHELFGGTMEWHLLGNYTDEKTRTSLGVTYDGAGSVSTDGGVNPLTGFSDPKFRATLTSNYSEGDWSLTGQAQWISSAVLSNLYAILPAIPRWTTTAFRRSSMAHIRGSYHWGDKVMFYAAVDNLFNRAPSEHRDFAGGGGTECRVYDCIGRSYRIGVERRFDD